MLKYTAMSAALIVLLAGMTFAYFEWERSKESKTEFRVTNILRRSASEFKQVCIAALLAVITWLLGQYLRTQDVFWTYKWQAAVFLMVPIAYIDYRKKIIPNKLLLIMLLAAVVIGVGQIVSDPSYAKMYLFNAGIGAAFGAGVFFLAALFAKNGIGAGDIKLFLVLGLLLAFRGVFNVLLYSTVLSFIVAMVMIIRKKKTTKDELPLAPFALFGVVLSIILGV